MRGYAVNSYPVYGHIINLLALELYFDGASKWGNEYLGSKYGRDAAISYMFDSITSNSIGAMYISGAEAKQLSYHAYLVVLLARLSSDEMYGEQAYETMLKVLKYLEQNRSTPEAYNAARIVSAYIAANTVILEREGSESTKLSANNDTIEYILGRLQSVYISSGQYSAIIGGSDSAYSRDVTASILMALGDYLNGRSILLEIKDTSHPVVMSDADRIAKDYEWLNLSGTARSNIYLPIKGAYSSIISWQSSDARVIENTGQVNRQSANTNVTLTATITSSNSSILKQFTILVEAEMSDNEQAVFDDVAAIYVPSVATGNLSLPSSGINGSGISWSSSNANVLTAAGTVNRPAKDTAEIKVTLTATVTKGDSSLIKDFEVRVLPLMDAVDEGYARTQEYYRNKKDLNGYWSIFAAYSVLGEEISSANGYTFFDPRQHKGGDMSAWQATDYAAVIMALIIMGENPYNYYGIDYVNGNNNGYGLINNKTGTFANNQWAAMAFDALLNPQEYSGSDTYIEGFIEGISGEISDIGGWTLVPLANNLENHAKSADIHIALDKCYSAMQTRLQSRGPLWGNTWTAGCIITGFSTLYGVTGDSRFDTSNPEHWFSQEQTPAEALLKHLDLVDPDMIELQLHVEFGDLKHNNSVWRRLAINEEGFNALKVQASEKLNHIESYTASTGTRLQAAYNAALSPTNSNRFGPEYFELQAAIKNLRAAGAASIQVYGDATHENILYVADLKLEDGMTATNALMDAADASHISHDTSGTDIYSIAGLTAGNGQAWYIYINGSRTTGGDRLREGDNLVIKFCSDITALEATDTLTTHLLQDAIGDIVINNGNPIVAIGTSSISLPTSGLFGTSISWLSNKATHL